MKLALFGLGGMGALVEKRALEAGHTIAARIDERDAGRGVEALAGAIRGADVAVDFSVAGAVPDHVRACVAAGVPLVEGTTGWQARLDEVREVVERGGGALVFGANFSVGVNLFYRVVAAAAAEYARDPAYTPFLEEAHHERKKDAPSGTALKLRDLVARAYGGRTFAVASTRAGHIPGTHRVGFDGPADQITLVHEARSREGFAAGALLGAGWIAGPPRRRGVFEFTEVLDQILGTPGEKPR
ncbi:MAG TPA: dihydrodipicolinate reductase C-terminal domain-containing protein [Gemmatimonadales bacterium]|nr:dihydrodipicolinate reductase C-terminal domain-containing protein [Gemmatimonadales bacterium]